MNIPTNLLAWARTVACTGLTAYVLGTGAEVRLQAQSSAWVGQVIAKYKYEHHDGGIDNSQLGTAAYDVVVGADGAPAVVSGRIATTWSAAYNATYVTSSAICGISQRRVTFGSGEGGGTSLHVSFSTGSGGVPGYSISGGSDSIFFEVLNQQEFRFPSAPAGCRSSNSEFTSSMVVFPFGAFVPSAADDKWVLTGTFEGRVLSPINSCSGATCQENTVTLRLRRANCTGAPDADGDGLNTCQEFDLRTDPSKWDTDGGGVSDGEEVRNGTDPHNPADDTGDPDGDGIPTRAPDNCPTVYNPDQANLDGDRQGNACDPDRDGDGLDNASEPGRGTNPDDPDTDDDTVLDGPDECPQVPGVPPTGCSGGILTATLTADYQTYWAGVKKKFLPFVKDAYLKVVIKGASSMAVTGPPTAMAMVQSVCLDMRWSAHMWQIATLAQWSEGPRLITGVGGASAHPLWNEDPSISGGALNLNSKVLFCAQGSSVQYSTYEVGRGALVAELLEGSFEGLMHRLEGWVVLTDGRTLKCEPLLTDTEKSPKRVLDSKSLQEQVSCKVAY